MLSNAAFDYFSTLYKPEFCMEMIRFCAEGRSPEAFAAKINVTPEIFPFWAINHIEFEIALHISFWKSYSWWEEQSIINPKLNDKIFNAVMKNRFKWKDGQEDLQKLVKKMSTKDLETLARRLLTEKTRELEEASDDDEEPEE